MQADDKMVTDAEINAFREKYREIFPGSHPDRQTIIELLTASKEAVSAASDAFRSTLTAALAHSEAEAVAWQRYNERSDTWSAVDADYAQKLATGGEIVRPLYAAPPAERVVEAIPDDLFSHRNTWRKALETARDTAKVTPPDIDDRSYWQHELDVFDRVFDTLAATEGRKNG